MTFTVFPKKCSRDLGRISGNESRSPEGFQKEATEKTQVLRSSLNDEVMTTAGQKGTHRRTAGSRESTGAFSSAQARPEQAGWLSVLPCLCSAVGGEVLHHQDVQREDLEEPLQFLQLSDGPSASQPPPSSGLPL